MELWSIVVAGASGMILGSSILFPAHIHELLLWQEVAGMD